MSLTRVSQSGGGMMKPLQQNNSQTLVVAGDNKNKIMARADSTGVENSMAMGTISQMKIIKHHHSVKKMQTPSVARRNARERNRVKVVNNGFDILKNHVPHLKNKVSKVETLKAAVDYIKALKDLLGEEDDFVFTGPVLIGDDSSNAGDDDSSSFSDLNDPSFSSTTSPDLSDVTNFHPMVYQLPPSIPSYKHSPDNSPLNSPTDRSPSILKLSPSSSPTYLIPSNLQLTPSSLSNLSPPLLVTSVKEENVRLTDRLPPMSVTATSWWPLPISEK